MNQAIANIIKTHIEGLDFVDKIAGLVQTVYMDVRGADNALVQKAFPIACCVTADDCKEGAYNDLMPNSQYKTVIYFEDGGVNFDRYEGDWKYYTSRLRLVCWINVAKILGDTCNTGDACTLSTHLIAEIIRALPTFQEHHNPFNFVYSEVTSQAVRDNSIFGKYTFDEKHIQYLMYPYDYFALDIDTKFAICLVGRGVYDSSCDAVDTLDAPVITDSDITEEGFTISWSDIEGATGYQIDIATDSGFTLMVDGWDNKDLDDVLTIDVSGLDTSTIYYVRVRAYNDTDVSPSSNTITVTTLFCDWFLPSKDELKAIYDEIHLYGLGGFASKTYWTSTEYTNLTATSINFANGVSVAHNKTYDGGADPYRARACRTFTDSTGVYAIRDTGPSGGLIFHIDGTTVYEVAVGDEAVGIYWSNVALLIGTTSANIGEGQNNTNEIIAQVGHTNSAAKYCDDLII